MPQPSSSSCSPEQLIPATENHLCGEIIKSAFSPLWWAKNRHVQTIWPRFFQRRLKVHWQKERLILPDSDFVNLAWSGERNNIKESKGLVVIFHGLEGSNKSHYANDMTANLVAQGYVVVLMHFRGCGGEHNTLPRAYHSGETQDAWYLLNWLAELYPNVAKVAMGFSLGANMLLKLLGEKPQQSILRGAIAISPPFKLAECSLSINQGMSRMYQSYLLKSMVNNLVDKMRTVDYSDHLEIDDVKARKIKSFKDFDQHVTAPLHGFVSADDYYEKCSAINFMHSIAAPTLIIHAKDDPFMSESVLPKAHDLSPAVRLELSDKGGHVGFMQGTPWQPRIWTHERVNQYFQEILREKA
ncbi:hydrolase [Paraglaciecola polaris]|uniref:Alpha/beta hydrolase fold family protein n=1 Tax=Paraglaciecola polaris LMG 21857 TaxID=1129793 RepID=K7A2B1_9ALTE|nr:hydrolase [Paraglaciecola polaris]GAC35073.1 alpha/beta hydrolase fold family protein [Paraglaciecola polaris LMG 21857]